MICGRVAVWRHARVVFYYVLCFRLQLGASRACLRGGEEAEVVVRQSLAAAAAEAGEGEAL